jgi:hypothetical protein
MSSVRAGFMDVELQYREAKRAVIIADYLNVASRQRLP